MICGSVKIITKKNPRYLHCHLVHLAQTGPPLYLAGTFFMGKNNYSDIFFLPGTKFHFLTILEFSHYDSRHRKWYKCRCDCGAEKTIHGSSMKSGNTKSCGCYGISRRGKATRLPNNGGVINFLILQYKRHARNRGIKYDLSREDFEVIIRKPCAYCGNPAGNKAKTKNIKEPFPYNGIDRLDSSKWYYLENCVPCCGTCNKAKRSMSRVEFLDLVTRIYNYQSDIR